MGEDTTGTQLYRHAKFHADWPKSPDTDRPHRRRDYVAGETKREKRITSDLISDKMHTSVAFAR